MSKSQGLNQMTGMSIRGRLLIGFGLITLFFMLASAFTLMVVTRSKNDMQRVLKVNLPTYSYLLDLGAQVIQFQSSLRVYLLTGNDEFKSEINVALRNIENIRLGMNAMQDQWQANGMREQWIELSYALEQLPDLKNRVDLGKNTASRSVLLDEVTKQTNHILDKLDGSPNGAGERTGGLYDLQKQLLTEKSNLLIQDMTNVQLTKSLISLLGMVVAIAIALLTARSIIQHINVFRDYSGKIAARDLRHYLDVKSRDEIGQLGHDLNTMTESLAEITQQITRACQNMVTTIEEVKQAVSVQSSGATEQASSINEITSSLEEIEKSSGQTIDKAKALGLAAERTRERGQQGLEAVEQSIAGMKSVKDKVQLIAQTILDLSNQTQQVGEITAVVNRLAQQSKMLALNASIEAAKAGEAGKGFAVVAAEVKNLAEQSEQSTAQVQKILENIRQATEKAVMATEEGTKGVDHGTRLVEQTGDIVRNLSEVIDEAGMATQQIEAAVRQESVGIEQITAGMSEINQVTSSFVVSAKQTMDAINNLQAIAKNLKENVDTYKV